MRVCTSSGRGRRLTIRAGSVPAQLRGASRQMSKACAEVLARVSLPRCRAAGFHTRT